jgi:phage terminase large subunit
MLMNHQATNKAAALAFQNDAKLFFRQVLGVEMLEPYQEMVIDKVWQNDRIAISACHDVGKSFLMARIATTFFNVFPNSKVITTAPTFTQVERILWAEIRAAAAKSKWPLGGKLNLTDWSHGPDHFALGFTPRNELTGGEGQGTQSSFQGFHAPHLLIIFDEATGIPNNIWTMAEGLMTSAHVKFVAIGNPTSTASEFYNCFRSKEWTKVNLTCFDSPNLIANGITTIEALEKEIEIYKTLPDEEARARINNYKIVRPYLLTTKWVVTQAAKWGLDHPLTVSKILGKFPQASEKAMFPLGLVEESALNVYYPTPSDRKVIGVDVARFGIDSSVLTALHGKRQTGLKSFYHRSITEVAGEVITMSREIGNADVIVVDETGLGSGVVDNLRDEIGAALPKSCEIRGVQFGAACLDEADKEKYRDVKARMFDLLRQDMKAGFQLLPENIYSEELPTIQYTYNKKGQMIIESKDEFKKRTGRGSPDHADSLALANYGNYDELTFGKFKKETTEVKRPNAPGLRDSARKW